MSTAFLEHALEETTVSARAGDIVVYESLEGTSSASVSPSGTSQWRWAVGEVLRQPTKRITEVRIWRKKEKLLDMAEKEKSDRLRNEIAKRKEELEREKALILSDQNSIASKKLRAKKKVEAASDKISAARDSMHEAQLLVAAVTDKQWAEVRGYSSPPQTVRLVLEAVLLVLNTSFTPGDWQGVRERVRDKDFVRLVGSCTAESLQSQNIRRVELEYLPHLSSAKVQHSSKAAVALHAWVVSMTYCMGAAAEMARAQEEIVLLDFEISELGEDSNSNEYHMNQLAKEISDLEAELEALYKEEEDDAFLMTTINTARGASKGSVFGGTVSDINLAQKSEFYSTLDTKQILSSQIFANLEQDVEGRDPLGQTMKIDPLKVLMTARAGMLTARGGGGSPNATTALLSTLGFTDGAQLPNGFKLSLPPSSGSQNPSEAQSQASREPSSSAELLEANRALKQANAEAEITIRELRKELAKYQS